jgi:hypothetical protein
MSSEELAEAQSCSCDFCQNVAGAIMSSEEGAELHLHPSVFWDPQLGPLHIGVFGAAALTAHENGYRGMVMDDMLAAWAENENVSSEDIIAAIEKLNELGYLVARNWIPGTHQIRWFIGSGLVIPHISGQRCEICPALPGHETEN